MKQGPGRPFHIVPPRRRHSLSPPQPQRRTTPNLKAETLLRQGEGLTASVDRIGCSPPPSCPPKRPHAVTAAPCSLGRARVHTAHTHTHEHTSPTGPATSAHSRRGCLRVARARKTTWQWLFFFQPCSCLLLTPAGVKGPGKLRSGVFRTTDEMVLPPTEDTICPPPPLDITLLGWERGKEEVRLHSCSPRRTWVFRALHPPSTSITKFLPKHITAKVVNKVR